MKVNGSVVTVPQHPVLLSGADKVQWLTVLSDGNSHDRLAYDGTLSVLLSMALSARAWQHANEHLSILC